MSEDSNQANNQENGSTGVQFEDNGWGAVRYYHQPTAPALVQRIVKYSGGIVRSEGQAAFVLVGFVVVAFAISLFLTVDALRAPAPPPPDRLIHVPS